MKNIDVLKLADKVEMWGEDLLALNMKGGIPVVQGAKMLRQQADRIGVLEANHKIQLNIVEKQLDYINQLEQGLRASIDLNKVVAEKEREACAKIADEYAKGLERNYSEIIADEIRARGQA